MRKSILLIAAAVLLLANARADAALLAYDGFADGDASPGAGQYRTSPASTDGKNNNSLYGQGPELTPGFTGGVNWSGNAGEFASHVYFRAEPGGLGYSDGLGNVLETTAGQVNLFRTTSGTYDKNIERASNNTGGQPATMYFSGLIKFTPDREGRLRTAWGDKDSIGIGFDDDGFAIVTTGNTVHGTSTTSFGSGVAHLLVGKISEGGGGGNQDSVVLYVDPTDLSTEANNAPTLNGVDLGESYYVANDVNYSLSKVYLSGDTGASSAVIFDEFRVATTWAEAVPVLGAPPPLEQTLFASADAHVQNDSAANSNFGSNSQLLVKQDHTDSYHRKSYVQFDLGSLSFDHTTELDLATLNLNVIDSGAGSNNNPDRLWDFEIYGLVDGHAGENWAEDAITWNNAPANDVSSGYLLTADAISLGTFQLQGKGVGPVEFSSPALTDFIRSSALDDLLTFIVVRNTEGLSSTTYIHAFASTEFGPLFGPHLALRRSAVSAVIPEPTTMLIWTLLAALGLGWRRRNR